VKKLTDFAGSTLLVVALLLIRCPSLRPDLSPVIRSVGASFGLYPKTEKIEPARAYTPFRSGSGLIGKDLK
jgi:hypothetical protein